MGESSRRLFSLMRAAGVDVGIRAIESSRSPTLEKPSFDAYSDDLGSNVISCVNPDQTAQVVSEHSLYKRSIEKHVGFWAWELEDPSPQFKRAARLVDEIWTISNFCKTSIEKSNETPVRYVQLPVPIPSQPTVLTRKDFGLPHDAFVPLITFDFFSDILRKNPLSAIDAYLAAFPRKGNARLIVKSINGQYFPQHSMEMKELTANRSDVIFMESALSPYRNAALIELSDVVLSLHRSEGYGLNLADAMARKTAVIATGYSGNLDFMDENSTVLVPYAQRRVTSYAGLPVNSFWADPDVDFAARALRDLQGSRAKLDSLASRGNMKIQREHSLEVSSREFKELHCDQ